MAERGCVKRLQKEYHAICKVLMYFQFWILLIMKLLVKFDDNVIRIISFGNKQSKTMVLRTWDYQWSYSEMFWSGSLLTNN